MAATVQSIIGVGPKRYFPGRPGPGTFAGYCAYYNVGAGGVNPGEAVKLDSDGAIVSLSGANYEYSVGVVYEQQTYVPPTRGTTSSTGKRYAQNARVLVIARGSVAVTLEGAVKYGERLTPAPGGKWDSVKAPYHGAHGIEAIALEGGSANDRIGIYVDFPQFSLPAMAGDLDLVRFPNPIIVRGAAGATLTAGMPVVRAAAGFVEAAATTATGICLGNQTLTANAIVGVMIFGAVKLPMAGAQNVGAAVSYSAAPNNWVARTGAPLYRCTVLETISAAGIATCLFQ